MLDTTTRISARHPVRNAFAGCSTGAQAGDGRIGYYATKSHAVDAFDKALQTYGISFYCDDCLSLPDNDGWKTLRIINRFDGVVGYARLSWHRMESGRYEFTGYIG